MLLFAIFIDTVDGFYILYGNGTYDGDIFCSPLEFWRKFHGVHLRCMLWGTVVCLPGQGYVGKLPIEFSEIRGSCEWTKIPSKSNWHKVNPVGVVNHFGIFRPLDQQRALIEQTTQLDNTLKKFSPYNSPMILTSPSPGVCQNPTKNHPKKADLPRLSPSRRRTCIFFTTVMRSTGWMVQGCQKLFESQHILNRLFECVTGKKIVVSKAFKSMSFP